MAEVIGDEMYFNAVTRTGGIMDSGIIVRRKEGATSGAAGAR